MSTEAGVIWYLNDKDGYQMFRTVYDHGIYKIEWLPELPLDSGKAWSYVESLITKPYILYDDRRVDLYSYYWVVPGGLVLIHEHGKSELIYRDIEYDMEKSDAKSVVAIGLLMRISINLLERNIAIFKKCE